MTRYAAHVAAVERAVFDSPGETSGALRRAIAAGNADAIPSELRSFVDKVSLHAYKVTDEDVDALKGVGYTEDQLFEVTVAAAVGAAMLRLRKGMAVIGGARP